MTYNLLPIVLALFSVILITLLSYKLGGFKEKESKQKDLIDEISEAKTARDSLNDDVKYNELCKKYSR